MKLKAILKKNLRYLFDKQYRFNININKFNLYKSMPDKEVLNNLYYYKFKQNIDWSYPKKNNEKIWFQSFKNSFYWSSSGTFFIYKKKKFTIWLFPMENF